LYEAYENGNCTVISWGTVLQKTQLMIGLGYSISDSWYSFAQNEKK
jgi:hypothetical protein